MISPALIQCDHVRAQPGFLFAFLFDLRNGITPGARCRIGRHTRLHRAVHARRDVFDRLEHVELEIDAFLLFTLGLRVEAIAKIVVLLITEFLKTIGGDMMIRDHEPIRGNEGTAAAGIETDASFLQVV